MMPDDPPSFTYPWLLAPFPFTLPATPCYRSPMKKPLTKDEKAQLRAKLCAQVAQLGPDDRISTAQTAAVLDRTTKTLERWRELGMGPECDPPEVPKGVKQTTQHFKYRKSVVVAYRGGGSMGFAVAWEPWAMDSRGRLQGLAYDFLDFDALLEGMASDTVLIASIEEALQEPWVSAAAMKPYYDEHVEALKLSEQLARKAFDLRSLEDSVATPEPSAPKRP